MTSGDEWGQWQAEPDEEPEIVTPAITRRRLRGGGGASWWARLLRRLAEATY